MKAKTMILSAIICGASLLGVNMTAAYAEPLTYELQATEIANGVETQNLSKAVRNRNTIIGAVIGAAAIAAIANHNNKKNYDDDNRGGDYHDRNRTSGSRNAPPPPPMPQHHR